MRITYLERNGIDRIAIITDVSGTIIRNDPDNGTVLATFGADRHNEQIKVYEQGGWVIV